MSNYWKKSRRNDGSRFRTIWIAVNNPPDTGAYTLQKFPNLTEIPAIEVAIVCNRRRLPWPTRSRPWLPRQRVHVLAIRYRAEIRPQTACGRLWQSRCSRGRPRFFSGNKLEHFFTSLQRAFPHRPVTCDYEHPDSVRCLPSARDGRFGFPVAAVAAFRMTPVALRHLLLEGENCDVISSAAIQTVKASLGGLTFIVTVAGERPGQLALCREC